MADVTASAEEYLEAICRLADRGEAATPTELARELHVAPPSVLGMLARLRQQGLVAYTRRTGATLTDAGRTCADTLRRRHRLAERLLTDLLHLPWARVHEIACRFEHVIDDEVEGYLAVALDHPTTCPHGNPLPGVAGDGQPLVELRPGEGGTLRCILDESAPVLEYLAGLGLRPGVAVEVRDAAPFDGPLTVTVAGQPHALARDMARRLLVAPYEVAA
jgi:DtxR family Mn-dependent transcriptional regulator